MRPQAEAKVARLQEADPVSFGPRAPYQRLTSDDGPPTFTGAQTRRPGYATPMHWHPYVEHLFFLDGTMEAWPDGQQASPARLQAGDMTALPACTPHESRNAGENDLRLLGIHTSPTPIVHIMDDVK